MSTHKGRIPWFDLVRALSALGVAASHLRVVCLPDYADLAAPQGILTRLFYLATGLGHQCVIIFFVLSGYFVGGTILGKKQNFSFRAYFSARLSRLWIVLIPALIFTLGIDAITQHIAPEILDGRMRSVWHSGPEAGTYSISVITFLGNIGFLQTTCVPVFGSNGPLWSLFNEWWYYVIFPLATTALGWTGKASILKRIGFGACAITIMLILPKEALPGFAIWLGGVLLWIIPKLRCNKFTCIAMVSVAAIAFIACIVGSKIYKLGSHSVGTDIALGCTTVAFLWTLLAVENPSHGLARIAETLSECSFSLYLTHFPLCILASAFIPAPSRSYETSTIIQFIFSLATLQLFGYIFYWTFERHTQKIRTMLIHALGGNTASQ